MARYTVIVTDYRERTMADKKGIAKLDEKLVSMRLIPRQMLAELPLVHRKMNSIIKKTGAILSDDVFETGNLALRKWLQLLSKQGASQAKLTAYLRCGLAHLTYDYTESQYKQIDGDDLVSRSILSLKMRKLHTSFFKPATEPKAAPAKKKATPAKKIKAIKKTAPKKTAPKKPAAKKPVAKKTAVKKNPAKAKAVAKKTPANKAKPAASKAKAPAKKAKPPVKAKAPAKKATVKKTVAKKTPTKKPSSR